ncbi:MAG: DUF2326 domain-containing protein [Planctomycetaceae bacterium]|jgi:uncharacterized protein YydD (DUF2326 family)|nr:DUF2326 domain-containing protein [Planctomycetaceae bacterium]
MIHSISANKPTFRKIDFKPGLNVIMAERTKTSSSKDTRNGLGKSFLVGLIDYCLGGEGKEVRLEPLRDWSFTLDVTIGENRVQVTRSIENDKRVFIEGNTNNWMQPAVDSDTGQLYYSKEQWRNILGYAFFDLPLDQTAQKFRPTFRSLFPYFIRTTTSAYNDTFSVVPQAKRWQNEVVTTYLLGLNWEYAARWQENREKDERLKGYAKYLKDDGITLGKLETDLINLNTQINEEDAALQSFKVLPQYEQIEKDANNLTSEIQTLVNQNIIYKRREAQYAKSVQNETPPTENILEELYNEVGVIFTEGIKKTLQEAREFHQKIIVNRRNFLENEIKNLKDNIQKNEKQIKLKTENRAKLMTILKEHKALSEWTALKNRYVETKTKAERLQHEIQEIKNNQNKLKDVKIERTELSRLAEMDKDERFEIWSKSVQEFNRISQLLYKKSGELVLNIDETGYKFNINIGCGGSDGIRRMEVFSFDVMLLQRWAKKIGFLIHDTIMFDPVDARQRALALEIIAKITEESQTQYICTFNQDSFPYKECSLNKFDFKPFINEVRLRDKEPSESLFGFYFPKQPLQNRTIKKNKTTRIRLKNKQKTLITS